MSFLSCAYNLVLLEGWCTAKEGLGEHPKSPIHQDRPEDLTVIDIGSLLSVRQQEEVRT